MKKEKVILPLTNLTPLVKGIAKTFGEDCEVVLHDGNREDAEGR